MNNEESEQTKLLREILKWIRFAGMKQIKDIIVDALDTDQKKIIYQLSDGNRGILEIGKAAGISGTATVFRYWKNWARLGLGDYFAVKGGDRFKRAFDLEELGIDVPQVKENEKEEKQTKSHDVGNSGPSESMEGTNA
jgi:hypothetical protein